MRKELAAERGCLVIASLLVLDELCVSSGRRAGFQLRAGLQSWAGLQLRAGLLPRAGLLHRARLHRWQKLASRLPPQK